MAPLGFLDAPTVACYPLRYVWGLRILATVVVTVAALGCAKSACGDNGFCNTGTYTRNARGEYRCWGKARPVSSATTSSRRAGWPSRSHRV